MSTDRITQVLVPVAQPSTLAPTNSAPDNPWVSVAFAWRRKFLVLFLFCVGLALGYLYFLKRTPVYQSEAHILVLSQTPIPLTTDIRGVPTETVYDRTRLELVTSPVVIQKAVELGKLRELPSFEGVDDAVSEILTNLIVTGNDSKSRSATSDVLTLTYTSEYREDCPKILLAIHQAFDRFMGETYASINDDTLKLITQAKEELLSDISSLNTKYNEFRAKSALLRAGESTYNVHEERLAQIESVRSAAVVQNSELNAKIQAFQEALNADNRLDSLRMLMQDIHDPSTYQLRQAIDTEATILPMLVAEQNLLENYGEAHPKVIAIRKEIELRRAHMEGAAASQPAVNNDPLSLVKSYVESLQERIRINDATIAEMNKLFDQEQTSAKAMLDDQLTEETFKADLARKERMFDAVVKRLEEISLVKDGGKVSTKLIHPPGIGLQIAPEPIRTFGAAGVLGLLLGVGCAYLLELSDRRFKSPEEIHTTLGVPVVGHIPEAALNGKKRSALVMAADGHVEDVSLQTIHAPKGRVSEAYRGVRTAPYFGNRGRSNQVVLITSPTPGDGKTTISSNLAVSIAQSGKRVLLLDADFRRPRVHSLFKLAHQVGMSSVLNGEVEIDEATQEGPVPNLFLLPCGPRPDNPAELLTSRRFDELIDVVRQKFDFVLIDAPPLLAVTDPLAVASRVDGVLLVMRLSKNARKLAARAISELSAMNARVLGVVVNAIGGTTSSGYGQYRYGYGFGTSGYQYVYGGYGAGYGTDYLEEAPVKAGTVVVAASENGSSKQ